MGKAEMIAAVAMLCGCVEQADGEEITRSCVRSFATTLAEWERSFGERVPAECALLDLEYDVVVVGDHARIPCDFEDVHGLLHVGCTLPEQRAIYILERDRLAMVDTSVHQWIHALSACVIGEPDSGHHRSGLWESSGEYSIEIQAAAAAELGECL